MSKRRRFTTFLACCPFAVAALPGCGVEVPRDTDEQPTETLQSALTAVYSNSFETSSNFPTGWTTWQNCAANSTWSAARYYTASDNPAPGGGSYALRLHTAPFTSSCSFAGLYTVSPAFSVTAGTSYQVDAWIRNGGASGVTTVLFFNASGVQIGQAEHTWLADAWQYNQETPFSVTAPTGATTAKVRLGLLTASTYTDVDLLKFSRYDAATTVSADGLWTGIADKPTKSLDDVKASATFYGPANQSTKMGVCLLKEYEGHTPCTTVADCSNAPSNAALPTGGARYCTAPFGTSQAYCYYRPGGPTAFCAGSPAQNKTPVPAGAYTTPLQTVGPGTYVSYACFGACDGTAPSVSSATIVQERTGAFCYKYPEQCMEP